MNILTEKLQKRQFEVIDSENRINGLLVGIDYDIGITIVDADDPKHHLFCANGRKTYCKYCYRSEEDFLLIFNKVFAYIVKGIRCGVVDFDEMVDLIYPKSTSMEVELLKLIISASLKPSSDNCPFNK